MDFSKELESRALEVQATLESIVAGRLCTAGNMKESIVYTLLSAGKKLRGCIVLWSCEAVSGEVNESARAGAGAVEMVHAYSLVHDDLPAMDDDDYRRGRLTCHKQFGEAAAILTGDALLTMAFELLASGELDPSKSVAMIKELSEAAGADGMIAGQMADLLGEHNEADIEKLEYIHTNKTAKMFAASAVLGGIAGGGSDSQLESLRNYGLKLGLAFQVADDILDVSATSEAIGKTAGKDEKSGKMTYPSVVGMESSRELERRLASEAVRSLESFGGSAEVLRSLAKELIGRGK